MRDLHAGHSGDEKTLLRARETFFWPGVSDDIRNTVKACDICQIHEPAQKKEPPMTIPSMPCVKLGIDIFEHRSHHYLLVADYFSKCPILRKMSNLTSGHVIDLLKTILAEYGIHQYLHPSLERSREAQIAHKQTQADYYNRKVKQLQDLKQYQNVPCDWILISQSGRKPQWFSNALTGHRDVIKCRPNMERNISETVDTCVLQFIATNQNS